MHQLHWPLAYPRGGVPQVPPFPPRHLRPKMFLISRRFWEILKKMCMLVPSPRKSWIRHVMTCNKTIISCHIASTALTSEINQATESVSFFLWGSAKLHISDSWGKLKTLVQFQHSGLITFLNCVHFLQS